MADEIKKLELKDFPDKDTQFTEPLQTFVAGGTVRNFEVLTAKVNELVEAENERRLRETGEGIGASIAREMELQQERA